MRSKKILSIFSLVTIGLAILFLASFAQAETQEEAQASTTENLTASDLAQSEPISKVNFLGTLIEVGSTDLPTTIIVRAKQGDIKEGDIVVNVKKETILGLNRKAQVSLDSWIPGDEIKVLGFKNENTGVVDAAVLVNRSFKLNFHGGLNGFVKNINKENQTFDIEWHGKIYTFRYTEKTHFVVLPKINASIDDLKVGDRIRGRYMQRRGQIPEATIVVALRRGNDLMVKIRTWVIEGELEELSSTTLPADLKIKIEKIAGKPGDINTLLQVGEERTVKITDKTRVVRRFLGKTDLSEFLPGDKIQVVGRLNDDGTIEAKVLKNKSIWKVQTRGLGGEVQSIDLAAKKIIIAFKNKTYTLELTDKAKIIKNGQVIGLEGLSIGDRVRGRGIIRPRTSTVETYLLVVIPQGEPLPPKVTIEE